MTHLSHSTALLRCDAAALKLPSQYSMAAAAMGHSPLPDFVLQLPQGVCCRADLSLSMSVTDWI